MGRQQENDKRKVCKRDCVAVTFGPRLHSLYNS
jgi:hypothetical protein